MLAQRIRAFVVQFTKKECLPAVQDIPWVGEVHGAHRPHEGASHGFGPEYWHVVLSFVPASFAMVADAHVLVLDVVVLQASAIVCEKG